MFPLKMRDASFSICAGHKCGKCGVAGAAAAGGGALASRVWLVRVTFPVKIQHGCFTYVVNLLNEDVRRYTQFSFAIFG
jgi:hypothetical protein